MGGKGATLCTSLHQGPGPPLQSRPPSPRGLGLPGGFQLWSCLLGRPPGPQPPHPASCLDLRTQG